MESSPTKTSGNQLEADGSQMIPRCLQMLPAAPPKMPLRCRWLSSPFLSAHCGGWAPPGDPVGSPWTSGRSGTIARQPPWRLTLISAECARIIFTFVSHSVQM